MEGNMPATHHVTVYPDHCSNKVAPPHQPAGRGDTIVFHTSANYLALFFPPGAPFEFEGDKSTAGKQGWIVVDLDRGATQTVRVRDDAEPGAYPYAVYCHDSDPRMRGFAKGGSDPEIIIYE